MSHRWFRGKKVVLVSFPQGARRGWDVGGDSVNCQLISSIDLCFLDTNNIMFVLFYPFCPKLREKSVIEHAQRVQVKVSWVTGPVSIVYWYHQSYEGNWLLNVGLLLTWSLWCLDLFDSQSSHNQAGRCTWSQKDFSSCSGTFGLSSRWENKETNHYLRAEPVC